MAKKLAALASLVLLISCAKSGRLETSSLPAEAAAAVSRADALCQKGSYTALKQAFDIYESRHVRAEYGRRAG